VASAAWIVELTCPDKNQTVVKYAAQIRPTKRNETMQVAPQIADRWRCPTSGAGCKMNWYIAAWWMDMDG